LYGNDKMLKQCNYHGCNKLIKKGINYCHEHSKEHDNNYKGRNWKVIRKRKILDDPLCEVCLKNNEVKKATIVHHIKDGQLFKELFFDYDNLMSVCRSCHNKIHSVKVNEIGFNINIDGNIKRIK